MRIVHVLAGTGWGGAERLGAALARDGLARGDDVKIVATPYGAEQLEGERLPLLGVQLEAMAPDGRVPARALFGWASRVREALASFAPDVVHLHLSTPAFAAAAHRAGGGAPSVWTFHLLPEANWPLDFMARVPSAWCTRAAGFFSNRRFVAVSRTDADALGRLLPRHRVECLRNSPPPLTGTPREVTRSDWGNAEVALLFVGRLDPQKGLDRLLRALAAPELRAESFHLLVIGDGPQRAELEALVRDSNLASRVSFLGACGPRRAFEVADLVLCPSRFEGTPLVPMEAVLAGAPVLVSRISPNEDLFGSVPASFLPDDDRLWDAPLRAWLTAPEKRTELRAAQAPLAAGFQFGRLAEDYRRVHEAVRARQGR